MNFRKIFTSIAIICVATLFSCGGGSGTSSATDEDRTGETDVTASTGGTLKLNNEIILTIPAGSLGSDATIKVERKSDFPLNFDDGYQSFGQAYSFTPDGTEFALDNPSVMELSYNETTLLAKGLDPKTLVLFYYDTTNGCYVATESRVDTENKKLIANVEHFTVYLPLAKAMLAANNAPTISLQNPVPGTIRAGAPIYLRATIRDNDAKGSIVSPKVYYRKLNPTPDAWQNLPMKAETRPTAKTNEFDTYTATVPAAYLASANLGSGNDFEYYVEAYDNLGAYTKSTTRGYNVTRKFTAGSTAISPSSCTVTAGFYRLFTVKGRDSSGGSFQFIPDSFTISGSLGTLKNYGTQGICFAAQKTGSGVLTLTAGSDAKTASVIVKNGEITSVKILDTNGNAFGGTLQMNQNSTYDFDVIGYDDFGNTTPVNPVWSCDGALGSIDQNGRLTTSATAATGNVTVTLGSLTAVQPVKTLSSSKDMLTFSLDGVAGVISGSFITVSLSETKDITGLVASFTTNGTKVLVGGSEQTSGSGSHDFTDPVVYTVFAEDGSSRDYTVTIHKLSSKKDITAFVINGSNGTIIGTDIQVKLPFGIDPSSLVASFTTTGNTVSVLGVTQANGVTANNFISPVAYTVIAEDGSTKNYTITVTVLGKGDGTFNGAVNYATGTGPCSVDVGDFNGDGKIDIVVANYSSNNVSILLGNGNGTFAAAVNYTVGLMPRFVTTGDFNGDGSIDVVTANYQSNNVSVLLGNGNGTFTTAVNYMVGSPISITTGDFNGDGNIDLAIANEGGCNVSILLGNGNGTFTTAVNYNVGVFPVSVTTGDFNGDGRLDLAIANSESNNVSILLGNGNGTFTTAVNYSVGKLPRSIRTEDFNGDGNIDLAIDNEMGNNVSILLGYGNGTFNTAVNYTVGDLPWSVTTGDFNGDGNIDLATANFSSKNVSILFGNGNGTFNTAVNYAIGFNCRTIITDDFNGDGILDIVTANDNGNSISVLLGK
jgi:hypothetical protein